MVRIATYAELLAEVEAAVDALIAGTPGALDTLEELAAALGDDENFAATVTTALAGKQPLDADLTALAGLTTTVFGRSLLTMVDAAAVRTAIGAAESEASVSLASQKAFVPKQEIVLFDHLFDNRLGYYALPSVVQYDADSYFIALKNGTNHAADPGGAELVSAKLHVNAVSATQVVDASGVINQNPELVTAPNGNKLLWCDQQTAGTSTRLGAKQWRATDSTPTWVPEGAIGAIGDYTYGYLFGAVNVGASMYALAMTFPNLNPFSERAVHIIRSDNNGTSYTFETDLTAETGIDFNECSMVPYGSGYLLLVRRDGDTFCQIFALDSTFQLADQLTWSASPIGAVGVGQVGRPRLLVKNGGYYAYFRNKPSSGLYELAMVRFDPDTLEVLRKVTLDMSQVPSNADRPDGFYAHGVFLTFADVEYLDLVTYKQRGGSESTASYNHRPDLVVLRHPWEPLAAALSVED